MSLITTGAPPGGRRLILADELPLEAPLVVQIFPVYACNLRCSFCHFSIPPDKREFVTTKAHMPLGIFVDTIDGMKSFERKVKVLRWVGMGEPLLHNYICAMVRYAKDAGVAEKVEILTNGVLLDRGMARALVLAGLDRLVVSVQGTSSEAYERVSGVAIDFDEFLSNLKWMYENRGKTWVHIKAIDVGLEGEEDEKKFFSLFAPVSNSIGIERAGPIYQGVEYNRETPLSDRTQFGVPSNRPKVCPQAFATMQVNPDGNVVPCYSAEYPVILGNVQEKSLYSIWHGGALKRFRQRMLNGRLSVGRVCSDCRIIDHRMSPEDSLDNAVARLKEVFGC